MTLAEVLARMTSDLTAAGVPGAGRDARILLSHLAGLTRDRLTLHLEDPAGEDLVGAAAATVADRAAGRPVSRILGWRDFYGLRLGIDDTVLDPRPETERLVELALGGPVSRVLDLGTGSGAILLAILAERAVATGVGTDISAGALDVARRNAEAAGLAGRATFQLADWFDGVEGRFDLILSNPPYITEAEMADLSTEVAGHDPHLALSPGGDGLGAYRAIAAGVGRHLAPGGRLMMEIGWRQGAAVSAIMGAAGLHDVRVEADLDGRDRIVMGLLPH